MSIEKIVMGASAARSQPVSESLRQSPATTAVSDYKVTAAEVSVAASQLQDALDSEPGTALTVDYQSGQMITTMRSKVSGQILFQLPNVRVIELARRLSEGDSLASLGLLDTRA